jgi:hypothetical protein
MTRRPRLCRYPRAYHPADPETLTVYTLDGGPRAGQRMTLCPYHAELAAQRWGLRKEEESARRTA